ncbi:hypothetical protein ACWCQN_47260 [Streptomyces sp. NPDC001984]
MIGRAVETATSGSFGLLFLAVVIFAFRQGQRWAWFACWAVLIAAIGYSATFGANDSTLLNRSLVADVALPVLLMIAAPSFFQQGESPDTDHRRRLINAAGSAVTALSAADRP